MKYVLVQLKTLKTKRSLQKQAERKDNLLTKSMANKADFSSLTWKQEDKG